MNGIMWELRKYHFDKKEGVDMSEKKNRQKRKNVESKVEEKDIGRRIRYKGTCSGCGGNKWVSEEAYKKLKEKKQPE